MKKKRTGCANDSLSKEQNRTEHSPETCESNPSIYPAWDIMMMMMKMMIWWLFGSWCMYEVKNRMKLCSARLAKRA